MPKQVRQSASTASSSGNLGRSFPLSLQASLDSTSQSVLLVLQKLEIHLSGRIRRVSHYDQQIAWGLVTEMASGSIYANDNHAYRGELTPTRDGNCCFFGRLMPLR